MSMESVESRESLDVNLGGVGRLVQRRWLPATGVFLLTVAAAAFVASLQKETYLATAKLLFRADPTATLTGVGEGVSALDPLVRTENPLMTEVEVISSRSLIEQVVDDLALENENGQPKSVSDIRQNLTVEIVGGADVLKIAYQSEDPEEAAAVANKLSEVYIADNVTASRAKASQARELIESQLPQAETFVANSEAALRQFKEENGVIAIDSESQSVIGNLQDLDTQILSTQAALVEATTRSTQLGSSLNLGLEDALTMSDLSQSPAIQGVLQELQQAERTLASQSGFYTDESPVVRTSQAQVERLSELLEEEVAVLVGGQQVPEEFLQMGQTRQALVSQFLDSEVQRLSLASRLQALNESRVAYQNRSTALPRLEQQESELQRNLEVARLNYQTLLQRLQELKVAENQSTGNAQLIESALVPSNPQSNSAIILLAGVLIGALLAATLVFLLELSDYLNQRGRLQKRSPMELGAIEK